jgi:hypothetical protein
MRIPIILADYPDWMFTGQFVVAAIVGPALLCLLMAAAARMRNDRRVAHGWLIAAGVWAGGLLGCVILGKVILRLV